MRVLVALHSGILFKTMLWPVFSFLCAALPATIASGCGVPGKPDGGIIKPEKLAYEEGEVVHVSCKEGFKIIGNENGGKRTCVGRNWDGNRPTCVKDLAFGKSYAFYGSDKKGGNVYRFSEVTEKIFVDFELSRNTSNAIVIFRGNLTATRNETSEPLDQAVYAHDFKSFVNCPLEKDQYSCISQLPFTHVKVEVSLKDQDIDLKNNPVKIDLRGSNRFIVYDYANIQCGTPDVPLNGTVSITGDVAVYECNPGYQLFGLRSNTCNTSKEDGILWPRSMPLCLEDTKEGTTALMAGLIATGCVMVVLLVIGMCCLSKRSGLQNAQKEANRLPLVPMVGHPGVQNQGYNVLHPDILLPHPPLPNNLSYPSPVQYPLIVSDLYIPESNYSSVRDDYDDVHPHIYEPLH